MYDKNQIIAEIKRVAKYLKTNSLNKKDFIKNTMIPLSTINFYISSWPDALKEAGLDDGVFVEEIKDKDLLEDLLRIEDQYGQTPTFALIEKNGRYSKEDYEQRWRTLDDAFKLARKKYQKKNETADKTILMSEGTPDIQSPDRTIMASKSLEDLNSQDLDLEETFISVKKEDQDAAESGEFSDNFSSDNILTIEKIREKDQEKEDDPIPSFDYVSDGDSGIENLMAMDVKKKKKKIIPETIKPINAAEIQPIGEPLNFRGLKSAPVDTRGVIYVFGLVSEELNFVVESFGSDKFCFSSRRNLSIDEEKWEKVNIGFALDSLDLKGSGRLSKNCELIVCWRHGWKECPVEVLELKTTLPHLDND